MEKIDKESFGQLLLIIGGFILAETIIKHFLTLADGVLPLFVLPLLGISMIFEGVSLINNDSPMSFSGWIFWIFIIIMVVFIVLVKLDYISNLFFLYSALAGSIITIVAWLIQ